MLLRRAPGFVAALILLPLSILAPAIPGYSMMVCRLAGTVVAADCGGAVKDDAPAPPPPASGWAAASCCDVLRVTFDRSPAEVHLDRPAWTAADAHALPIAWSVAPLRTLRRADDACAPAPPGLGPPRRLVKQSFLI